MDDVITITIEIYKDDKVVYIAEENSSGSNYNYEDKNDIVDAFKTYIDNIEDNK